MNMKAVFVPKETRNAISEKRCRLAGSMKKDMDSQQEKICGRSKDKKQ